MTTKHVADTLGVTERTVRRHCLKLGWSKQGRDWIIPDPRALWDLTQSITNAKPGRPRDEDRPQDPEQADFDDTLASAIAHGLSSVARKDQ